MLRDQRILRVLRTRVGTIVVLGLLAFGLTGCYTQLKVAGSESTAPRAEASVGESQDVREGAIDPDNPVRSLRRAHPESRAELVSLAKRLQEARADTEISYSEYREGVHFFRTNYPSFYGNYFGDPFYATYDIQYHTTARDAWRAGLDVNPHRGFRDGTAFLCAPHGYDPAFGCRSWAYAPSDFFFLPDVFAFSGLAGTSHLGRFPLGAYSRSLGYGYGGRFGFASPGLFGYGGAYGYGSFGYGGSYGPTGILASAAAGISDVPVDGRRGPEPRRGTLGRGSTSTASERDANRTRNSGARPAQTRSAEGRDRERSSRGSRTGDGDRERSGEASGASGMRGDALRMPEMPVVSVFGAGVGGGASALDEVEHVRLETVRVSPPPLNEKNRTGTLRTYQALQRIAENADSRTVSIEHQEEMSAIVRHIQRTNTYRTEGRTGRHRGSRGDRRDSGARRTSGRSSSGGDRARSTRDRGSSASGRSRSGRSSGGDSGRDRSRSRSDDSGGR